MRRRIHLHIGEIPYVRVEYIESTDGLPCIDTGVVPNANTKVESEFQITQFIAYGPVFGNYIDESTNVFRLIAREVNAGYYANPDTKASNPATVNKTVGLRSIASVDRTSCSVDDYTTAPPPLGQGTANTSTIALLKNKVSSTTSGARVKMYWCKIYDNGTLIRDYIPVRFGLEGYLLDQVSGTLYGNAGGGSFALGADLEHPDNEVDLADDSFVLMNYRREDLESPAAVLNSWSQSIDLPRTGKNSAILGHYYRLDHTTTGAGGTGVNFNALKRTPFTIYDTLGRRVQSGYIKLEKVTRDAFSVTLFGGLGGMFYALTYTAGGDKLTLADLKYNWAGGTWYAASGISVPSTILAIADAWSALMNYGAPSSGSKWDIINFAPALNGTQYPFKFDTNKAMVEVGTSGTPGYVANLYDSKTQGGVTYGPKRDSSNNPLPILVEMGSRHNEWETQDLRTYCQRPVISMRKLVEAIIKFASDLGYTLTVDSRFYTTTCDYFEKVWMTLPFLNRDNYTVAELAGLSLADYLAGTNTPADYLLAIAKTFGFVFLPERDGTTVRMMLRDTFYGSPEHIDITPRVDRAFEVQPLNIGSRLYEWKPSKVFGGFATEYETRGGRVYGSQRVDTGYDFSNEVQNVIESNAFNGCADVRDKNLNYQVLFGEYQYLPPPNDRIRYATNYAFKFTVYDTAKWELYHYDAYGQIDGSISCDPAPFVIPDRQDYDIGDAMFYDLPQLCDKDGKSEDGNNVLLFFEGSVATPIDTWAGPPLVTLYEAVFHLSEDQEDAVTMLNGGTPCWDMRYSGTGILQVGKLPSFRRWHYSGGTMVASLDYGDPTEIAVQTSFTPDVNIYVNYWSNYIADRLDANTSVLRAYVNLEGWDVGEALFRNFYYYGGSVWALNAIENYSLTTAHTTLCEFVRVNDTDNYNNGQL